MSSLYGTLLGAAWSTLAPAVRRLHGGQGRARGSFRVRRGTSGLARLLANLLRMPRAAESVAVTLSVEAAPDGERWVRAFAGQPLETLQLRRGARLVEVMGLVQCIFRLRADEGALVFEQVGASFGFRRLRIPLPRFLAPFIEGRAAPERDDVRVDVRIHAPLVGLLVAYDGLVTPQPAEPAP